jgi:hypothetical protein
MNESAIKMKDDAETKALCALRKKELEKILTSCTPDQRSAIIRAVGADDIPGIPKARGHAAGAHDLFHQALDDLEYTLVMADNHTFQHAIDAFEQKVSKLLK